MSSLHILSWLVMARNRDNVNIKLDGLMYVNCPFILLSPELACSFIWEFILCVQGLVRIHAIAFSTSHVSSLQWNLSTKNRVLLYHAGSLFRQ